jgi:hypothetical protein
VEETLFYVMSVGSRREGPKRREGHIVDGPFDEEAAAVVVANGKNDRAAGTGYTYHVVEITRGEE